MTFLLGSKGTPDFTLNRSNPSGDAITIRTYTAQVTGPISKGFLQRHDSDGLDGVAVRLVVYDMSDNVIAVSNETITKKSSEPAEFTWPGAVELTEGVEYQLGRWQDDFLSLAKLEGDPGSGRRTSENVPYSSSDAPPDPFVEDSVGFSSENVLYLTTEGSNTPQVAFTDGDPDTRLRDRDGLLVTAADVPIRVSTQRDPRGAPALTGAPATMSITDGEATLDLSAADPLPTTGDAIYVEVFDEKATPEDDVSRRYVLRMQDGATAGG